MPEPKGLRPPVPRPGDIPGEPPRIYLRGHIQSGSRSRPVTVECLLFEVSTDIPTNARIVIHGASYFDSWGVMQDVCQVLENGGLDGARVRHKDGRLVLDVKSVDTGTLNAIIARFAPYATKYRRARSNSGAGVRRGFNGLDVPSPSMG